MDESCSPTMEPWLTFCAADNEAVTRALQMSLSDDSSTAAAVSLLLPQPEPAASDHSGHKRARNNQTTSSPTAKIKKRKPRASKRSTTGTTYITADPANFREMVQLVTGVQGGPGLGSGPEQQRTPRSGLQEECGSYMPTLDTSAFLFEQAGDGPGGLLGSGGPVRQTIEFGPFASFPTLESWGAM